MDASIDHFPFDEYLSALIGYLDTVKYSGNDSPRADRLATLRHVYSKTANHFAKPTQMAALGNHPKLFMTMRASVHLAVLSWVTLPVQVMTDLSIYWVYLILLDDVADNPRTDMETFAQDLLHGRPQKGSFLRLMNDHLSSSFLPHYSSFCSLTILRSTLDYYQGCWIETHNFGGFPGSEYYPLFLRRLNGVGGACGASLFPAETFDEDENFEQITTVIAQIEPVVTFINDMFSFYKEFSLERDQINTITNECRAEGISFSQAFNRLTDRTISAVEQLQTVSASHGTPVVAQMIQAFIEGYTTWHICSERYRMREIYDRAATAPDGIRFRRYYEAATDAGLLDGEDWTSGMTELIVSKQDPCILKQTSASGDEHQAPWRNRIGSLKYLVVGAFLLLWWFCL